MNDRKEPTPAPDESTKPAPPPAPPSHDTEVALEDAPEKAGSGPPEHFGYQPVDNPLEAYQKGMRSGFIPVKLRDFHEAWQFADILVKSKLLPKDIDSPGKCLAIMLTGQEIGVPPMAALRTIHIVDGRPTLGAELMLAKFAVAGGTYEILEHTHETCRIRFNYRAMTYTSSWDPEDTERAGLLKPSGRTGKVRENWTKYPKRMCLWRAVDNGLSIVAPELFLGLHTRAYAIEAVEYEPEDAGQRNQDDRVKDLQAAIEAEQAKEPPLEETPEEQPADEDLGLCEACDKPLTADNRANEKICLDCAEGTDDDA